LPPSINYDSAPALRAFLTERRLGMQKKFGQNFLINRNARQKLLDALEIRAGDAVWEIGPGLGAMTQGLLARGAAVTAFEIDRGFIEVLGELFGGVPGFCLVPGDALKTWPLAGPPAPYLLGNLPYNIAAALLADFIEKNFFFTRMVVTVQKEVARRIMAAPGSADYSSLSVLCASAYTTTPLPVLKGASFYPAPRVDSQGIRFDIRTDIDPGAYPPSFKPLLRGLFAARRKTVKNNLQNFVSSRILNKGNDRNPGAETICLAALDSCGIRPNERAENLGLSDFAALAGALEDGRYFGGDHDNR
jgi:16S rRNA (adenine1518-N6/adenine1519-N6)-dimethyltransferase